MPANHRGVRARLAVIAVAALAVFGAGAGVVASSPGAAAGIGPGGYAQVAQQALQRSGGPFGYRVTCTGVYSNYGTAQVRVTCTMNEQP